jgi:hypothetical protein
MSVVDACATWLGDLPFIAWQFLKTADSTNVLASAGSAVFILHYLRKGAVPGGRMIAVILLAAIALVMWALVLSILASPGLLDQFVGTQCRATRLAILIPKRFPAPWGRMR